MAQATPILRAERGRVLATAGAFLCLLALVQLGLFARALWRAAAKPEPAVAASTVTPPAEPVVVTADPVATPVPLPVTPAPAPVAKTWMSPPPPGQLAAPSAPGSASPQRVPAGFGPPPIGSLALPVTVPSPAAVAPAPPASVAPMPAPTPGGGIAPTPAANPADPATTMSLQELLDLAKQVRGLGDMQGALEVLRRADLRFPAQPEVLTEMALCYEQMGLNDKAAGLWRQLSAQDPNRAGGFRDLAQRRLNAPAAGQPAAESGQVLGLGACRAQRDAAAANGEKVVLRIPILRQGNIQVDPAQVDIDVYFFDRVNGQQVALTIADEPPSTWTAPPVDWGGIGEEPLDVTYFLPTLTPGEVAAHGRRAYHGYVVRLYYQNKLQDVAAEPRDLLDFGLPTSRPEAGAAHPLLPPVAR